jgi:hypothetical protein
MLAVGGDEVRGASILDDANIAGPPEKLLECAEALLEGGNQLGLELRWAKCKLLWQHLPAAELPNDIRTRFEELGVPIVFNTTKLLGVPIGTSEDIQESLMQDVDDQQPFFDSILHDAIQVHRCLGAGVLLFVVLWRRRRAVLGWSQRGSWCGRRSSSSGCRIVGGGVRQHRLA